MIEYCKTANEAMRLEKLEQKAREAGMNAMRNHPDWPTLSRRLKKMAFRVWLAEIKKLN